MKNILVTGGCGFVGSHVSLRLRSMGLSVWVVDNFRRAGSELNALRLRDAGIHVVVADIRRPQELDHLPVMDAVVLAAAEPSVLAGVHDEPHDVISVNLNGTMNCLELARRWQANVVFLSSSRVYSIEALRGLPCEETESRLEWIGGEQAGFSPQWGIAEEFSTAAPKSLYGATKFAAETMIAEYGCRYGLKCVINRFGLIAGPWQLARADQGVITLWVARHLFGQPLRYCGFGGRGLQVRDVLHVDDASSLIVQQIQSIDQFDGQTLNVGGGQLANVSLSELTRLCQQLTGCEVAIACDQETSMVDIPLYITDNRRVKSLCGWQPEHTVEQTVADIARWVNNASDPLRRVLGG